MKQSKISPEEGGKLIAENTEVIADSRFESLEPTVSVVCITFNHERFLERAIQSVLEQTCDFPVELIIGEDHSNDGTLEIAKRFQSENPARVSVIRSTENLGRYTGNGRLNFIRGLRACRGRFVAILEGDDFWNDPGKLARQVEYLESHPEASGCFTDCDIVDEQGEIIDPRPFWNQSYQSSYTQAECLADLGSAYGTATLLFRRTLLDEGLPDYFIRAGSDFLLDLAITRHGTLDYLPGVTAAYRIHPGGIWQGTDTDANVAAQLKRLEELWIRSDLPERCPKELEEVQVRITKRLGKWLYQHRGGENDSTEIAFDIAFARDQEAGTERWELSAMAMFLAEKWGEPSRVRIPLGEGDSHVDLEITHEAESGLSVRKHSGGDENTETGRSPDRSPLSRAIDLLSWQARLADREMMRAKQAMKRANNYRRKYQGVLRSRTYRVGRFLLKPLRIFPAFREQVEDEES